MNTEKKTGVIRFFKEEKLYGFIRPDDGGEDVFVSFGTLRRSGYDSIEKNEKVSYDVKIGKNNKMEALTIKKLN